ncbi:DUF11 domain-containing protein [Ornithinibacillus sp. BX22]|uniref:DUF11 domain-containing protein n=1 Tax=Ornithinibacillus hominis TaxID=2763055 RepID=A0A923L2P4_9BACI|nr:isopeptide-forming domain-containing fimbrial protein [Ornithinibacillus hominis]MBC5635351.1 DUF11 domain-containing protein [Ornithinibacillus hominis]
MRINRKVREGMHQVSICLLILLVMLYSIFPSIAPLVQAEGGAAEDVTATATDSKWLTYKFDEFSNDKFNQLFTVNGAAEVPNGAEFIRLTPAETIQSGAVFNNNKLCPVNNYSFSTAFSFMMSNQSAAGPSDGLTFTLQTGTTSLEVPGGSVGYYGLSPSFTIKYDTFKNDVYQDPSDNYIGLATNGELVNQPGWFTDLNQYNASNGTNFVLSNGTMYYTWIDYDSVAQTVQVLLGTTPDRASANKVLDVDGIDLSNIFGGQPFHAGFTAATGSPNYETHDIHSWYFVNDYAPITTLNPQNDYKIAPSNVELVTESASSPGVHNVTVTLTDPSGNPVAGAVPDSFTTTSGELTGPNGEPLTELVSDTEGKIHALLVNADHSTEVTVSANVNCIEVSDTIPATEQPPDMEEPPVGACPVPVALINGSFEEPTARMPGDTGSPGAEHAWQYFYEYEVPGWQTTASDKFIQIMKSEYLLAGMEINPPHGNQYAELNADQVSALYQDVETTPRQTIYWRVAHRGLLGEDTMAVQIGSVDTPADELPVIQEISTGNTGWEYYSGSYTVPAGQATTRFAFNSIDAAGGDQRWGNLLDDVFLGTKPCVVAEKTVSPEGEVFAGQELTYEVTVKNNGGDIAADAVFEDAIPEGTEYVPGSLKIIDGPGAGNLTDIEGDDAGHFDGKKVIVELGDLPNTNNLPDGITVQFKVKALDTDAEREVINKAFINYNNLLINERETTETNETTNTILPREGIDACAAPVALINGSFEEPDVLNVPDEAVYYDPGSTWKAIYDDFVPGWQTTDSTGSLEVGSPKLGIYPDPNSKYHYMTNVPDGEQYVELNAYDFGQLYQDVETTPGQTISWRLSHRAAYDFQTHGYDKMAVRIGSNATDPAHLPVVETISTHTTEGWVEYRGNYSVPAGQTITRFGFEAVESVLGEPSSGNFLDNIFLGTEPCVVVEKTVSPEGEVLAGQELTYEVTVKNNGGDIAANAVFEDAIPAGTKYVPGSLKIIDGPGTGDLTDQKGDDAGWYDEESNNVIIELGDLPNTNDLPNGVTVQFKVKALVDDTVSEIINKAKINYDNLLTNESKTTESNETTTELAYQKPVLESQKTAEVFEKADGNTDLEHPEVGDILTYTIQTRNTVEDSLVKNLIIRDELPEGLEYVTGTLSVDGVSVTDEEDDDAGHSLNGEILGSFGDITDTEWHTVTFQVVVGEGQASKDIKNIATVDGDNLEEPDEPSEEVLVYPRNPNLESDKFSSIEEKGEGNNDADKYQVGDTIKYTIQSRNTVRESVVENFVISDVLPEGLTYVEGSLEASHEGATNFTNGAITANFGEVTDDEWRIVTFLATIDAGQSGQTIQNTATVDGDNVEEPDEPSEEFQVDPREPRLESEKTYDIAEKLEGNTDAEHPEVGDILTYTIQTRNTIEDSLVKNLTIHDVLPEGLEYVEGTLTVDGVSVTDEEDEDVGHSVDGEIFGAFGDITDTEWHSITFQVEIGPGQAGQDIKNIATVDGDNIDEPDEPSEEVLVYPR